MLFGHRSTTVKILFKATLFDVFLFTVPHSGKHHQNSYAFFVCKNSNETSHESLFLVTCIFLTGFIFIFANKKCVTVLENAALNKMFHPNERAPTFIFKQVKIFLCLACANFNQHIVAIERDMRHRNHHFSSRLNK